ncbi:hypothetical protein Pint_31793 [Pistacia integerrima]|uniref:Uncharacterized protein n=1 Tax=Pistacia integerrima TaxID=434235 RepID=A0ACC0XQT4_9ROSI|nr:hypothetical protein Pint_31793 [Pistacia integerrima]
MSNLSQSNMRWASHFFLLKYSLTRLL